MMQNENTNNAEPANVRKNVNGIIQTPRWLQGLNVGWGVLELGVLGFISAGLILGWPLVEMAALLWDSPNAPVMILITILSLFYIGDMTTLIITYKIKKSINTARLSGHGGPRTTLFIHMIPGIYLVYRFLHFITVVSLWIVHVLFLLLWDVVFLALALPLQLVGVMGEKFGKVTDKIDELREAIKMSFDRFFACTAPF